MLNRWPENTVMTSFESAEANRINASNSTGPRTTEGKKRSSQNAIRHGLSGRVVVLPTEDLNLYLRFSKEIVASLYPETQIERDLAQNVADGLWRQKRFRTIEEAMLALGHYEGEGDFDAEHEDIHAAFTAAKAFRSNPQAFATLSIYEQRIQRGIEKAMKMLTDIQAVRIDRRKTDMVELLRLHGLDKMMDAQAISIPGQQDAQHIPAKDRQRAELTVNGFVYSSREIELEALRRTRREEAILAEKVQYNYAEFQRRAA
jgi:hypothetical protein